ncbi:flagellar basal body rod protein FlgB [Crassaminicella profunda]|uniref:flagellar basal body rod protein FlgB n=1 Tax=Crassaminicella profunda TaxID=1286698 RepID=UPI001CA6956D|nr:flagellar basal body rod protein FlgB [Crassaminicella profunda]QZY56743.1 flagellar basal body rod protein FlgB [Crassaminicella profunda]
MSILNKSFRNINILEKSMDACWLRNEAISNNIANVNTPKFKRNVVKFESILAQNISGQSIEEKLTHEKHLSVGNSSIDQMKPMVTKDITSKYRKDGNNVNVDVEMANLSKNTIRYYMLKESMASNLRKLNIVIKDGR